jgi:hypothetical protein
VAPQDSWIATAYYIYGELHEDRLLLEVLSTLLFPATSFRSDGRFEAGVLFFKEQEGWSLHFPEKAFKLVPSCTRTLVENVLDTFSYCLSRCRCIILRLHIGTTVPDENPLRGELDSEYLTWYDVGGFGFRSVEAVTVFGKSRSPQALRRPTKLTC